MVKKIFTKVIVVGLAFTASTDLIGMLRGGSRVVGSAVRAGVVPVGSSVGVFGACKRGLWNGTNGSSASVGALQRVVHASPPEVGVRMPALVRYYAAISRKKLDGDKSLGDKNLGNSKAGSPDGGNSSDQERVQQLYERLLLEQERIQDAYSKLQRDLNDAHNKSCRLTILHEIIQANVWDDFKLVYYAMKLASKKSVQEDLNKLEGANLDCQAGRHIPNGFRGTVFYEKEYIKAELLKTDNSPERQRVLALTDRFMNLDYVIDRELLVLMNEVEQNHEIFMRDQIARKRRIVEETKQDMERQLGQYREKYLSAKMNTTCKKLDLGTGQVEGDGLK